MDTSLSQLSVFERDAKHNCGLVEWLQLPNRATADPDAAHPESASPFCSTATWYSETRPAATRGRPLGITWCHTNTIIPDQYNSLDWDRYSYVRNNPLKYVDPSGHSADCGIGDPNCRAGTIADPSRLVFEEHKRLAGQARHGNITDLEAFARLADYAATLTPDCAECFVQNLGATLTGHTNNAARNEVLIQAETGLSRQNIELNSGASYSPYYRNIRADSELMQSGYDPIFQDPGAGGNQAHHYWFYVQVGYENGMFTGIAGSALHETALANNSAGMSYQDFALGAEGATVGQMLAEGIMSPGQVGNHIRDTLSPGSPRAGFWNGSR